MNPQVAHPHPLQLRLGIERVSSSLKKYFRLRKQSAVTLYVLIL